MNSAFPSYAEGTQLRFIIAEMAYDLYKQDWINQHTTPQDRLKSIHDYYAYVQECMELGDEPESYEDYLFEYGFDGSLYVCYDEFCDAEYQDQSYITNLLNNDPVLTEAYFDDLADNSDDDDDNDDTDIDEDDDAEVTETNSANTVASMHMTHTTETGEIIRFNCDKDKISSHTIGEEPYRTVLYPRICKNCFNKHPSVFGNRYRAIAAGWCMVSGCKNPAEYYIRFEENELCVDIED